jgi:hypothetical protein
LSVEGSRGSSGSAMPDEAVLGHIMDRIELMRKEFEELLFLRYAAEMLKDFRKRLLQERWD